MNKNIKMKKKKYNNFTVVDKNTNKILNSNLTIEEALYVVYIFPEIDTQITFDKIKK